MSILIGEAQSRSEPSKVEQMIGNRSHPRHSDALFSDKKHYIVCFKDVMFEASCRGYELVKLSKEAITSLVMSEVDNLSE